MKFTCLDYPLSGTTLGVLLIQQEDTSESFHASQTGERLEQNLSLSLSLVDVAWLRGFGNQFQWTHKSWGHT